MLTSPSLLRWGLSIIGLLIFGLAGLPAQNPATPAVGSAPMADSTRLDTTEVTLPGDTIWEFKTFTAADLVNDGGGQIELKWEVSGDAASLRELIIYRRTGNEGLWDSISTVNPKDSIFLDASIKDGKEYSYKVRALGNGVTFESASVKDVISHSAWFDWRKINLLIIALVVIAAILYYAFMANKKDLFIRRIAGLQSVDEAVGRATEMGRSVLFIPGIQDLDDVQTLAGLTILGSVSKLTAQYETKLDVPVSRSLVMSNGREVVKESYLSEGRPDLYNDDIVHYVTDEQFGYVAAIDGIMVREQPAACFYMGAFFAESLILAETGNSVGAIQIAGTAMPSQLPFFVAACDYTLIGEELFAASAYLSKDQRQIATLRGQDVGKALAMIAIAAGSVFVTFSSLSGGGGIFGKFADAFVRLFALNF